MTEFIVDAADGIVTCGHRKAAIIGAGPLRRSAPWHDDSWCFFQLNEIEQPRGDRHYELHPRAVQSARDLAWLKRCPMPCYVLDPDEWDDGMIPHPVRYPLERVLDLTGGRRYFTNTFALEVALAIADGFEEIGLWGVDLSRGTLRERLIEQPCLAYWVGLAQGRGIRVTMPEGTTLCRQRHLYGYEYDQERAWVDQECDEAVLALPRARWPAVLQRLRTHYGGQTEAEFLRAAADVARTSAGALTDEEFDVIKTVTDGVEARVRRAQVTGAESAE